MNKNQEEFEFPSLQSDFDFEPNLEFDDELTTEETQRRQLIDNDDRDDRSDDTFANNTLLMEDDFESALKDKEEDNSEDNVKEEEERDLFRDLSSLNIIEVNGDDFFGRIVISIHGSRLPVQRDFDWNRFLRYILATLDSFVEIDYTLVYFHFGLKQKPPLKFLWTAFRSFDRKYRKHLKALLLVHPTPFTRFILSLFKPLISAKFGRKVFNVNRLEELSNFLRLKQISIPEIVLQHDKSLERKLKNQKIDSKNENLAKNLKHVMRRDEGIPHVIRACVDFLSNETSLQTEGLFRRSSSNVLQKEFQRKLDLNQEIDFRSIEEPEMATHLAAALLKQFLRQLEEPLLTFDLFDDVIDFQRLQSHVERVTVAHALIRQRLPEENRKVLEFLLRFLRKVINRSDLNKMNAKNLSIVFGPNLLWPKEDNQKNQLENVLRVNQFTEFLFTNDFILFRN